MPLATSADWAGVLTEGPAAAGAASLETSWGRVPRIGGVPGCGGFTGVLGINGKDDNRGAVETDAGHLRALWHPLRAVTTWSGSPVMRRNLFRRQHLRPLVSDADFRAAVSIFRG